MLRDDRFKQHKINSKKIYNRKYKMNLSRNFTLSELTKSDTAIRKGINNNPNAEQIEKLKALCENIYSRSGTIWQSQGDERFS